MLVTFAQTFSLKKKKYLFHCWLRRVSVAVGFSLLVENGGHSLVTVLLSSFGLLIAVASLVAEHSLQTHAGFSSCSM